MYRIALPCPDATTQSMNKKNKIDEYGFFVWSMYIVQTGTSEYKANIWWNGIISVKDFKCGLKF